MIIFYIIAIAVGILWFIDEILSFRNLEEFSRKYNKPPIVSWFLHHHAKGIIYLKLGVYTFFLIFAAELVKKYYMYFHLLLFAIIIIYLIFDIKVQRKIS